MKRINNFDEFINERFLFKTKFEPAEDKSPKLEDKPDLNDVADIVHPIDYSLVTISEEDLTPEKLEDVLDVILSIEDPDVKVRLIRKLKSDHPHIIDSEPYKKIYWNAIKKWHESIK